MDDECASDGRKGAQAKERTVASASAERKEKRTESLHEKYAIAMHNRPAATVQRSAIILRAMT
jgi:hypothetical protein